MHATVRRKVTAYRVSRLTCLLAEEIGLSGHQLKAIERGALLHDIGKIGITDTVLHKPGKLTDDEWKTMRIHPDIGARIVEGIPFLQDALSVIRYHHERWDGSGYPIGLKGKGDPDSGTHLCRGRRVRCAHQQKKLSNKSSAEEAIQYIKEQSGILFDPLIVEALDQAPLQGIHGGGKDHRMKSRKTNRIVCAALKFNALFFQLLFRPFAMMSGVILEDLFGQSSFQPGFDCHMH